MWKRNSGFHLVPGRYHLGRRGRVERATASKRQKPIYKMSPSPTETQCVIGSVYNTSNMQLFSRGLQQEPQSIVTMSIYRCWHVTVLRHRIQKHPLFCKIDNKVENLTTEMLTKWLEIKSSVNVHMSKWVRERKNSVNERWSSIQSKKNKKIRNLWNILRNLTTM